MTKICHVSNAHIPYDIRIFEKECQSLAQKGYEVHLVISGADGLKNGVVFHDIGTIPPERIKRMFFHARKAYKTACEINADIYHFHDLELLPYAVRLRNRGKKVIFDSHENILDFLEDKKYIPRVIRKIGNPLYKSYIGRYLKKIDLIITVDPVIKEKLQKYNPDVEIVANYPIIEDTDHESEKKTSVSKKYICFAGGISAQWNHLAVMQAAAELGITYVLCGRADSDYLRSLESQKEWKNVDYRGMVSHKEAMFLLRHSIAGVALLDYSNNSNGTLGTLGNTKIFEIMMEKVPLICTDFISWKNIVETENCGICIEPKSVEKLKESIQYIIEHENEAEKMGERGHEAVIKQYNWSIERQKLFESYERLECKIRK